MVNIDIDRVICSLVDKLLDRRIQSHDENYQKVIRKGMMFEAQLRLTHYTDDENFDVSRQAFILFTGNTSVFMAVAPQKYRWRGWSDISFEDWKNTSNHDSCWRSDGVRSPIVQLYFDMNEEINNVLIENCQDTVAPFRMSQFNSLGFELFEEVYVEIESDPDAPDPGYFRKIKSLSLLNPGQ